MPALSWPEIRNRATTFARDWKDETSERAEAQTFWNEFFEVFGVNRKRTGIRFEKAVERFGKRGKGRIDVFWPGTLLTEHKSADQDPDAAHTQATNYFDGLSDIELPRYVIASDFQCFRLYDLEHNDLAEFNLSELPARISLFGFIAGYSKIKVRDEDPLNIKAVQLLGELHDALKNYGYGLDEKGKAGHVLQMFLVRVLFCLFADDTGLFSPKDSFLELVERTREDGADTGALIARLFQTLNVPRAKRQKSLEEEFGPFPYINGRLFEESLPIAELSGDMRGLLLDCCNVDWKNISPAIFGAMFQKVVELDAKDRRRQLGAHYTSEANIRKVIDPLFLDELRAEFEKVKNHKNKLYAFHDKLRRLRFLDPACGCGNFLVITYRELRKLELDVLREAAKFGAAIGRVFEALQVNVDQFYGIEIEEFPAQVTQVAMWLTDHQMNVEAGREFGEFFDRLPLDKSATIRHGNALRLDWEAFVPPDRLNYILGNPPFVGKHYRTTEQREDLETVAKGMKAVGDLDYVAGWYLKAAQYLSGSKEGFVSRDKRQFQDARFGRQAPGI
ncbi:MAG: class I SAM-dependent DNA methyltransferase, partial [Gammaproteobacteria bacterium]|nr:class I SAM-dependent DNA methyltransferase [Gammaproteobacteria bacterium]